MCRSRREFVESGKRMMKIIITGERLATIFKRDSWNNSENLWMEKKRKRKKKDTLILQHFRARGRHQAERWRCQQMEAVCPGMINEGRWVGRWECGHPSFSWMHHTSYEAGSVWGGREEASMKPLVINVEEHVYMLLLWLPLLFIFWGGGKKFYVILIIFFQTKGNIHFNRSHLSGITERSASSYKATVLSVMGPIPITSTNLNYCTS